MPPPIQRPTPAPRGHQHRSTWAWAATILRRSARGRTVAVISAALLAAITCTGPAALARQAEPGPAAPVPGPSARPPSTRPVVGAAAAPAGDLRSLRTRATRLRARLDGQHRRLEVLSEDLEEAYARGVGLLAEASQLDRRGQAAEREVAAAQAELDERARASYMAGPGWFVANLVGADNPADALARLPLQRAVLDADLALVDRVARAKERLDHTRSRLSERLVDQARGAEQLATRRAEAERLADDIQRELRTMDRRVATLIEQEQRRQEATQRAAFVGYLAAARTAGTPWPGTAAPPQRPPRRSRPPWPSSAPPTCGAPRAPAPSTAQG